MMQGIVRTLENRRKRFAHRAKKKGFDCLDERLLSLSVESGMHPTKAEMIILVVVVLSIC